MIIKMRAEPEEIKVLRYLNVRMELSPKDTNNYLNLEKGFIGEQKFDLLLENLSNNWLILNDLLFEYNNTYFQIDTLLISQDTIYIIDVKNYEGDFYIDGEHWYTKLKTEIKNPLEQLKRSESLLRRLLQEIGFTSSIESYLVFINPEFYLYQAPLNLPIIFPTQLNRFLKKLNMKSSKPKERHLKLAEQLVSLHIKKSPYKKLPAYTYDQVKKGCTCKKCNTFTSDFLDGNLVYRNCGIEEDVESAILRSVEEINLLFPDQKITTNAIYEWCVVIQSKKTIRRVLSKNFKVMGNTKSTFYEEF